MTVEEVANLYGTKSYQASKGMNITDVVRALYSSDLEIYYTILTKLNSRVDWSDLNDDPILYLKKSNTKLIVG